MSGPVVAPSRGLRLDRFSTLVTYVFRACLPARKLAVLALPCVAAVGSGLLALAVQDTDAAAFTSVANAVIFGLAVPLGSLVIGDAVLGAEVRAGTFTITWMTSTPVAEIAVARWLGGVIVAAATLVPAVALAAVLAGAPDLVGPVAIGALTASAAHIALFVAIGAVTRRAAVWSLAILFLVERLIAAPLGSVAQLSPTWLGREVFVGLSDQLLRFGRDGVPDGWDAVARLGVLTAAWLALASFALSRLRLTGARD